MCVYFHKPHNCESVTHVSVHTTGCNTVASLLSCHCMRVQEELSSRLEVELSTVRKELEETRYMQTAG